MVIGVQEGGGAEGGYREIMRDSSLGSSINIAGLLGGDDPDNTAPNNGNNYRSTVLANTSVRSFFTTNLTNDDGALFLFALTEGFGIWRATYDSGVASWSVDLSR